MMYYRLYKKFYVNSQKYKEFSKILFADNYEWQFISDIFCLSCGNGCTGLKQLCYNKNCYRFTCNFSYNYSGKTINNKEDIEISEEKNINKQEIELCVGIKKNANLDVLNTEIDLYNYRENEYILMCYLKSNTYKSLDIDFDEILKFLPFVHTKYSSITVFKY
jgi:hypothetical protein